MTLTEDGGMWGGGRGEEDVILPGRCLKQLLANVRVCLCVCVCVATFCYIVRFVF